MFTLIYHDGTATRYEDFDTLDDALHWAKGISAYEVIDSDGFTVYTKHPRQHWV